MSRKSASEKLELLATETGGLVYFIADDGAGFSDAFDGTITVQPGSSLGRAQVDIKMDNFIFLKVIILISDT